MSNIEKVREYIKKHKKELEESEEWICADEETKLTATMDNIALSWKEDEKGKDDEIETVYLYLSSAVRDRNIFPSPGQYKVVLDAEIDNIIEASLIQASFPLTEPTVNKSNYIIRYSFAPHTNPVTIEIPVGSYKGENLAIEITRQLNQSKFAAQIPIPYKIDDATGAVVNNAGNLAPGQEQFKVVYIASSRKFIFQLVDQNSLAVNNPFALHIQPLPLSNQQPWRNYNDDLFSLLGFDRNIVEKEGLYDMSSDTYYLISTTNYSLFGPSNSIDQRYTNSLHGNQYSDLRGSWLIVLDIDVLNNNDIAFPQPGPDNRFDIGDCFGVILVKDPAFSNEGMIEISSGSYPVKKYYRNGKSRIKELLITLKRPDGTMYNFGGLDHFMALKFQVKRTQPDKPVFCR